IADELVGVADVVSRSARLVDDRPWPRRRRFKAWKIRVSPNTGEIRDRGKALRTAIGLGARRRLLSEGERCGRCGPYTDEEMPQRIHVPLPVDDLPVLVGYRQFRADCGRIEALGAEPGHVEPFLRVMAGLVPAIYVLLTEPHRERRGCPRQARA